MRTFKYLFLTLALGVAALAVIPPAGVEAVRAASVPAGRDLSKEEKRQHMIDTFFDTGTIPRLRFEFAPEEWENVKKDHRRYAECVMIDESAGGKAYKGVAVKLKGSAGSFQGPDGKPGLTVSFTKFKGAERYRGMSKFHLNNGAQDGTYLQEAIAGEMSRKAGVPASRCTHALVTLNGRDLGLYVFKEGFTKDFLAHFFREQDGDLYDGGFVKEIEENMEKDEGDPKQRENIKELIAACREGDQVKRWERLEKILDVERFLSSLAMEAALCHWDGYNFNRNNYRVYFDAASKKAVFFLHGMDQTFGDANGAVLRDSGAMVGQAVLSNPAWKKLYRDRVDAIYEKVFKTTDWAARVTEVGARVRAALEAKDPKLAKEYEGRINEARSRVSARVANIAKQLGDLPKPMDFGKSGIAKISRDGWRQEGAAAQIDEAEKDGKACLHVRAEGASTGSWRRNMSLEPGRYRFEAKARTAGVEATGGGSGEGAGVRISGGDRNGQNAAKGDAGWQTLGFEFDAPGGDVVLVAELRATKGDVWFERDSFQLVRLK